MALTMAEVGQPRGPQTRCAYTCTFAPAPATPATPTVRPTIVPVVCVPWSFVSDGSLSFEYQSRPAMIWPGWDSVVFRFTHVSDHPMSTRVPPAPLATH